MARPIFRCSSLIGAEIDLSQVFSDGWARLGAASPNQADLTPRVRLMRFDGLYGRNIANLVALLAAGYEESLQTKLQTNHAAPEGTRYHKAGSSQLSGAFCYPVAADYVLV